MFRMPFSPPPHRRPEVLLVAGLILVLVTACLMAATAYTEAAAENRPRAADIRGEDGSPVLNHRIDAGQVAALARLATTVSVGNPDGDVTLYEFYDLNCPYCRRASADLDRLLQADKKVRAVLVPFPVLGVPSIQAGRVEFVAVGKLSPQAFHAFHRGLYAGRGIIDGNRALAAAREAGLQPQDVIEEANKPAITEAMKSHVRLGNAMGLVATPSWIVGDVAIVGHPGYESLKSVVAAMRACGKVRCGP